MTLTARRIEVTEESKSSKGDGGAYASIEVPGDYAVTLVDAFDYDKGPGKTGWEFHYDLDGLTFKIWLNFSKAARWKLIEVVEAHLGRELEPGDFENIDPNDFLGDTVGAHIDWQYDPDGLAEGEKNYREIKTIFAMPAGGDETVAEPPAPGPFEAEEPEAI